MEKKELKMYEAPAVEVVEMGTESSLLLTASSGDEWVDEEM